MMGQAWSFHGSAFAAFVNEDKTVTTQLTHVDVKYRLLHSLLLPLLLITVDIALYS